MRDRLLCCAAVCCDGVLLCAVLMCHCADITSPSQEVTVFPPKYNPHDPSTFGLRVVLKANQLKLFLLMGRDMEPIERIHGASRSLLTCMQGVRNE